MYFVESVYCVQAEGENMESEKLNELIITTTKDIVVSLIESKMINNIEQVKNSYSEIYHQIYSNCTESTISSMPVEKREAKIEELIKKRNQE
jgi:hypothetical protein